MRISKVGRLPTLQNERITMRRLKNPRIEWKTIRCELKRKCQTENMTKLVWLLCIYNYIWNSDSITNTSVYKSYDITCVYGLNSIHGHSNRLICLRSSNLFHELSKVFELIWFFFKILMWKLSWGNLTCRTPCRGIRCPWADWSWNCCRRVRCQDREHCCCCCCLCCCRCCDGCRCECCDCCCCP